MDHESRLVRMERELRRWRAAAVVGLGVVGWLVRVRERSKPVGLIQIGIPRVMRRLIWRGCRGLVPSTP